MSVAVLNGCVSGLEGVGFKLEKRQGSQGAETWATKKEEKRLDSQ